MRATNGQQLAVARQEVERWRRKHGGRGSRIPEELWSEAAKVARAQGVYATARALRLNYERLKDRVGVAKAGGALAGHAQAAFVELPVGSLGGGRTIVEFIGRGGEQMRIHLASASSAGLVGLAEAFWSRRS